MFVKSYVYSLALQFETKVKIKDKTKQILQKLQALQFKKYIGNHFQTYYSCIILEIASIV